MNLFKIDMMLTSQSSDFECVETRNLEAEGFYGLFRLSFGENYYGTYIQEAAGQLHPQDDLYYWIEAMLEVTICISEYNYCAVRDIEYPRRWIEFVVNGSDVTISVIDADNLSSAFCVKDKLSQKTIVLSGAKVDKQQLVDEIIDCAKTFIDSVVKIEPRFGETKQHKRILDLMKKQKLQ